MSDNGEWATGEAYNWLGATEEWLYNQAVEAAKQGPLALKRLARDLNLRKTMAMKRADYAEIDWQEVARCLLEE